MAHHHAALEVPFLRHLNLRSNFAASNMKNEIGEY